MTFQYPADWTLDSSADDGRLAVSAAADDSCFWSLHILPDCPAPDDVVASCIAAFEEEYDDVECTRLETHLAEMPATAREISFSCFELLNTACVLSVRTSEQTLLVLWQGTDHELPQQRPLFAHMTESVRLDALQDSGTEQDA